MATVTSLAQAILPSALPDVRPNMARIIGDGGMSALRFHRAMQERSTGCVHYKSMQWRDGQYVSVCLYCGEMVNERAGIDMPIERL